MYTIIHYNMNLFNSCNYFFLGGGGILLALDQVLVQHNNWTQMCMFLYFIFFPQEFQ